MKIDYDKVVKYYLILNRNCNMNCIYCVQGEEKKNICNKELPNPKDVAKYFPENNVYTVAFYGGEPFLYFDYMIECAKAIRDRNPNVYFRVTTNGSLLTVERAKILNSLDFLVNISHDGWVYEQTRKRKDFLKINPEPVCTLKHFMFVGTVTKYNWDYYEIWDYFERFYQKYGLKRRKVNLMYLKDSGGHTPLDLFIYNNKDFEKMLDKVVYNLKNHIINKEFNSYEYMCYENLFGKILRGMTVGKNLSFCGSLDDTVEIDIYGNIYFCHNALNPWGHFNDKEYKQIYVPRLYKEPCLSCDIRHICLGACPMATNEAHKYMCYYIKNEYGRIWNMLLELANEGVDLSDTIS